MKMCAAVAALAIGAPQQAGTLASRLSEGAQLFYYTDGRAQPPWIVDSIRTGQPLMPNADCATMTIRRRPSDTKPEHTKACVSGDTLFRWEPGRKAWSPSRPVGPDMTLTVVTASGDTSHYETGALGEDLISGAAIQIVTTTITTVDAKGRPRARVRERYAVSLAAATSGLIETPVPSSPGTWDTKHNYSLKELKPGAP
jgi:hypothetical protein